MKHIQDLPGSNTFYAPAGDECWVQLAKAIMEVYAIKYSCLFPTTAYTQAEYDRLNHQTYQPMRRSVLKSIKTGPLRHVVDMQVIYAGLEKDRLDYKRRIHVRWTENCPDALQNI